MSRVCGDKNEKIKMETESQRLKSIIGNRYYCDKPLTASTTIVMARIFMESAFFHFVQNLNNKK